jgi:hypothetical protein
MAIDRKAKPLSSREIFKELKRDVSNLDCVSFAENYLTIDGKPFDLSGSGWKYMGEMYRIISAQIENPNARPIILLKGRQVGATIMAGVLSLHMASSGLYGTESRKPAIRVMHVFPDLKRCGVYAKDILSSLMSGANDNHITKRSLKEAAIKGSALEDSQTQKNFMGMNKIRVDSIGKSGDRIRGSTQDVLLLDECHFFGTKVATDEGDIKIGNLYELFRSESKLPNAKSFNETTKKFEYKKILNAWHRGKKDCIRIVTTDTKVKCTPDHKMLTTNGWKEAKDILVGDAIIAATGRRTNAKVPNSDQTQLIIGSFLGDGNIHKQRIGMFVLRAVHGLAQKDYNEWKAQMVGAKLTCFENNGFSQKPACRFASANLSLPFVFPKTKTYVPQSIIDNMDARALAVWFMDDGSAYNNGSGACISTCSFDEDSNLRLVSALGKLGISAKLKNYFHKQHQKHHFTIYISADGYRKLSEIISPYVHATMRYKLSREFRLTEFKYEWDNQFLGYDVALVKEIDHKKVQEEVYDIEVEDNHNFIITNGKRSSNVGGLTTSNCQDMTRTAIENSLKVLTATPYGAKTKGVQVFFGTPKHAGSYFWNLWEDSDQRFYQLKCKNCEHYFFLYNLENDDWNDIWVKEQQVKCPMCSRIQNKLDAMDAGRWIATRPYRPDGTVPKHIGYHFNMMLSPLFTKENVLDYWPQHNKNASERAWRNETKGQFYSAASVPITLEEVHANCLDLERGVAKSIVSPQGRYYFLGMDWGEKVETDADMESKRGKSYTCAVILSVDHTGVLTIENAVKLRDNSPDYKMNVVRKLMADFHIEQAAADFYYANDFVRLVQSNEGYGDKFLGCTNLSNSKKVFSYDEKEIMVGINKDRALEELFGLMKRGMIKIPAKDDALELLSWLVDHITSMETHIKVKDGIALPTYKKGTVQNDGLMALMYAYTAYKFMVTRKFSENGPGSGVNKNEKAGGLVPVLGHIPRMH